MKTAMITRTALVVLVVLGLCGYAFAGQTIQLEAEDGSYASNPIPADGAVIPGSPMGDDIYTTLDFDPGETAVKFTGYFHYDYDKVASRAQDANLGPPPYGGYRYYAGLYAVEPWTDSLVRGVTYYWCVDETDAMDNTYPGDIWEFTIQDYKASFPNPPDGAVVLGPDVPLSWEPGFGAQEHDVYFGTDFNDVNNAFSGPYDTDPPPEYLGTKEEPSILITGLSENTTYYWRVDEVSNRLPPPFPPGNIYKGDVWCFRTRGPRIFVDADATGANDGSSWADAFNYLQDAFTIAWPGAEIKVAEGIYKPDQGAGQTPSDRNATFQLISGVAVKGGYAGFGEPDPDARDIELYDTILTGDLDSDDGPDFANNNENSYHVVTGSGTDETGVLDGFTITAGNAEGSWLNFKGGGMDSDNGSPTLTNCTFRDNWASRGGGMYNGNNSRPMLTGCTFMGNIALDEEGSFGGGMCNDSSSPVLNNCIFTRNLADVLIPDHGGGWGGGMFNDDHSSPTLTNCTFSENTALCSGGGMTNRSTSSPTLSNCTFTGNLAKGYYGLWGEGGGMFNDNSSPTVTNCTFKGNSTEWYGGGMFNRGSNPTLTKCTFSGNWAENGGGMFNVDSSCPILTNCVFIENSAANSGGGMGNDQVNIRPILNNCLFSGNSAVNMGGGIYNDDCGQILTNCTFVGNSARYTGGISNDENHMVMTNCIFWGNWDINGIDESAQFNAGHEIIINYCCVQGWTGYLGGTGNIGSDPLFVDVDGIDNIIGTEDDNLRLLVDSPCIDAGDNSVVTVTTDLDGNPRIANGTVDMGAYEFQGPFKQCYYVDGINGDDNNDGLSLETAFATIQKGIDTAIYRDSVIVYPAVYDEALLINNKAIRLQGVATSDGIPIIQKEGDYAISYYVVDGPDSLLKNFVITGSELGILIVGGSPTISNVTIVDNVFGIAAYANAQPDISNCILWNNTDGDLFGDPDPIEARYSCVQQGSEGDGNISIEPQFVDANNSDYHLLSERGRHWPAHDVWVLDKVTSPCVDGGDLAVEPSGEPMPNGGRINMGAYGNTAYASMSEWPIAEDNNRDGIVNMIDIAKVAARWLEKLDWVE